MVPNRLYYGIGTPQSVLLYAIIVKDYLFYMIFAGGAVSGITCRIRERVPDEFAVLVLRGKSYGI